MTMFGALVAQYHLHPIVDHFTIALLAFGVMAEAAASILRVINREGVGRRTEWVIRLSDTSIVLMLAGAAAAVCSYFTGDAEADRVWDAISPQAQQILAASGGSAQFLSHAVLGSYLMWTFLLLAGWRVSMEFSPLLARLRVVFTLVSVLALSALLYQGKTGGDLVYGYGVGTPAGSPSKVTSAKKLPN